MYLSSLYLLKTKDLHLYASRRFNLPAIVGGLTRLLRNSLPLCETFFADEKHFANLLVLSVAIDLATKPQPVLILSHLEQANPAVR
jgi:hypothetical protein